MFGIKFTKKLDVLEEVSIEKVIFNLSVTLKKHFHCYQWHLALSYVQIYI